MNKGEAVELLEQELDRFRRESYEDLVRRIDANQSQQPKGPLKSGLHEFE